eukprot:CAMPEP_0117443802 /NCGR_PEP_ID=MMETSP0759-20121206/4896_1 /TAXON_ID=63605 /ORGANISM="Percolomonas cosmopolitus, Strain WS" /LENGTH=647 /DNA_ID=CAMNT_0005235815 /DNA_START=171 /DNA_END=2111 /DNA_ORIENTATION=+
MKKSIAICAASLKESYAGYQNLSIGDLTIGLALVAQEHSDKNLLKETNENPSRVSMDEGEQLYGEVWQMERELAKKREEWREQLRNNATLDRGAHIADESKHNDNVKDSKTEANTPSPEESLSSSSNGAENANTFPQVHLQQQPYTTGLPIPNQGEAESNCSISAATTSDASGMLLSPSLTSPTNIPDTVPSFTTPPIQQINQATSSVSKYNPDNVSPFLLKTCMEILETAFLPYESTLMKRQKNILSMELVARHHEPVHIAYVDHKERRIVISVRGTNSIGDVFTDFSANAIDFETTRYYTKPTPDNAKLRSQKIKGKCHHGMFVAAKWILGKLSPELKSTFRKHPDYSILTCGHSLGGASSAILALLLREWCMGPSVHEDLFSEHLPEIKCITFACPAVFSKELSLFCQSFTTTFCVGADIVTRLASGQAEILRQEILNSRWKTKVGKWYTEWNETKKPFEKINGFLGKWNLPVIPTQLDWHHSPTSPAGGDVDPSKILTLYPCGSLHLLTYHDKGVPQGKTRIVTQKTRPFTIHKVSYQHFSKIILHSNMFHDHRISNFFEAFEYLCRMVHRYELENNASFHSAAGRRDVDPSDLTSPSKECESMSDLLEKEETRQITITIPPPVQHPRADLRAKIKQDEAEIK